jgi:hypothetical protein
MAKTNHVSSEESTASETMNAAPNGNSGGLSTIIRGIFKSFGRLLWYATRKIAYTAFIIAAVALILIGLNRVAEFALSRTYLGYVYSENFAMAKQDLTEPVSHYDYDISPGVCILHNQPKGNRYEYANNAGFRDPRPISVEKPGDEFRIFLTGGSTAFGLGAVGEAAPISNFYYIEHRETISHALEKILNATAPIPGKTIRVYNAAVWGYSYQHLLLRYITKLRRYKPDLVISFDGVNEINAVTLPVSDWDYFKQGQYNGILRQIFAYDIPGLASYLTLWLKNNTYLMTFFWSGMDLFQNLEADQRMHRGSLVQQELPRLQEMPTEERSRMVAENVAAVVRVVEDYHSVLENDGVPHIFALQPMLYLSKKPRHENENKVESLEEHKYYYGVPTANAYKYMIDRIAVSAKNRGFVMADFSEYFDDTSQWVFTDWCHLTAGANYLIAKELANLIKENFFRMPLAEGDNIEDKDSFFWDAAATAKVVYAPTPDAPANDTKNMLWGYPGRSLYSSKVAPQDERFEVALDLNQALPLSRLRLVWDHSSVPEEWAVDISVDGDKWNTWIQGNDKGLDSFSWWPGYEWYGAEPVRARYLRYRPIKSTERSIKLRSLSVYR